MKRGIFGIWNFKTKLIDVTSARETTDAQAKRDEL
jgi:hypothetical protein